LSEQNKRRCQSNLRTSSRKGTKIDSEAIAQGLCWLGLLSVLQFVAWRGAGSSEDLSIVRVCFGGPDDANHPASEDIEDAGDLKRGRP